MVLDKKTKEYIYYIFGGGIVAAAVGGAYAFYKKLSKPRLNDFIEEYFREIEEMLEKNKGKTISVEIIGHIFQIITELEDYLYNIDNHDLEDERIAVINNEQQYRLLFAETMETRNEYYEKATRLVEERLKISIAQLDEVLRGVDIKETKNVLKKAKKPYKNVPGIEKSKVREAFIYMVQHKKQNERYAQEQMFIINYNPDYRNRAMANIYFIKNKLKDEIRSKFGFEDKYMDQLVEKHDLLQDSEVKYYHDELSLIE